MARDQAVTESYAPVPAVEVSIVMPCLNEAETLEACIRKAKLAIARHHLAAEIIVADNGSRDRSVTIARAMGARVVHAGQRGYGAAIRAGVDAAEGRYVVIGDADDSYDFAAIGPFIDQLRAGSDLVIGNRFKGGIDAGAMPWTHRYIGNPVLTAIGRIFFRVGIGDFHCGLRAIRKDAYQVLKLRATGMEFASEMVVKAALKGLWITEVPTVLHRDGRSRPPHLRTFRDGWRHLRFMLLFSPRWLFIVPGLALLVIGVLASGVLVAGEVIIGPFGLDIGTLLVAGLLALIGYQVVLFGVFTKIFAVREGFHPPHKILQRLYERITLEVGLTAGALLFFGGLALLIVAVLRWRAVGFGALDPRAEMRELIPAMVLMALGVQTVFASFFLSILGIETPTLSSGGGAP
jgi:glycosyltransferase involved in cell wall biosynthesis